jgi:DNA mismatch repair protein MutS
MTNTNDLHIEEEILPLFDFTYNINSGREILDILKKPLGSKSGILFRQHVLKGFIANREIFKEYSFSRFNLSDVYDFFETFSAGSFLGLHMRRKLIFSEKERHYKRGKLIILILLFNKIYSTYLGKMDTKHFPDEYVTEINRIDGFLLTSTLSTMNLFFGQREDPDQSHRRAD